MHFLKVILSSWIATNLALGSAIAKADYLERRQISSATGLPSLGSESTASVSATASSVISNSNTQSNRAASNTDSASASGSSSRTSSILTTSVSNLYTSPSTLSPTTTAPLPTSSATGNGTSSTASDSQNVLPLPPRITPALAIGGVVLLLTGIVYALIGVKNRWIHIFLSTAYLTSLSITVLIVYVLNPPVPNAIQGAYFVGIFMTGIIFGAGALIFKEVTEGLGCLLGGFCLSMWFLTLKAGGLIPSTSGKAIFISIFCVLAWSLSFSHYTRPYGLMVCTSLSGSTAFVLGIDCFSRGGLKEFWLYIWNLNDNLFPLNTNTYPITRGTRVETVVIILISIIGVISQLKLWKIVKDRQNRKDAEQEDEGRRREVVEAALGRHLERQNDRDRVEWEKQYGDRLGAKRETILWTDAHTEKGYTKIKETEIKDSHHSSSSESLEMATLRPKTPRSMYVTKVKRRSSMPVGSLPEIEEIETEGKMQMKEQALEKLEGNDITAQLEPQPNPTLDSALGSTPDHHKSQSSIGKILRDRSPAPGNRSSSVIEPQTGNEERRSSDLQRYLSTPDATKDKKRRSFSTFFSRPVKDDEAVPNTSWSQEALVIPDSAIHHSRASSLAATLDFENEMIDLPSIHTRLVDSKGAPQIVISPVGGTHQSTVRSQFKHDIQDIPPSPPALSENFDLDPEELMRPLAEDTTNVNEGRRISSGLSSTSKRQSQSETGTDGVFDDKSRSRTSTTETSQSEVLTKGTLEQMPSQLSHVVMSYRTNEWAKHISTADAPIFEEPEVLEAEAEAVTHLADPTVTATAESSRRSSLNQAPPPPEVAAPVPSAVPSPTEGIRINPVIRPEPTPTTIAQPVQVARVRSISEAEQAGHGVRSVSTSALKSTLQAPPIAENTPLNFTQSPANLRSTSQQSFGRNDEVARPATSRSAIALNNYSTSSRPATAVGNYANVQRSTSKVSLTSDNGGTPIRSPSQSSGYQQPPQRSETRMKSYDSHQPLRRNSSVENQRREARFTNWRVAQSKTPFHQEQTGQHRQQMLMERQQIKMVEEQEKNLKWQQELAIDARMRGKDMQELHREAMKRMQANANKKLTN